MSESPKTIVISVRLSEEMKTLLDARAALVRQPITRMASMLIGDALTVTSRELEAEIVRLRSEIECLQAAANKFAARLVSEDRHINTTMGEAVRRERPKMLAAVGEALGVKPVAAVLPVSGTQFPSRPVHLRGEKGKKA